MSQASELELLMLDLINEERTSRGLTTLEINNDLNEAAEDHSAWMLRTNQFDHRGAGGSTATDRIEASGYELDGSWSTAENIGWQSERGATGLADDVRNIHDSLMNSPGHRANILNPNMEDIGIGIERGDFTADSGTFDGVMVTQNFGRTDAETSTPPETDEVADRGDSGETETPLAPPTTPEPTAPEPTEPEDQTPSQPETPDDETPTPTNGPTTPVNPAPPEPQMPDEETPTPTDGPTAPQTPTPTDTASDCEAFFARIFDRFDFGDMDWFVAGVDDDMATNTFSGSVTTGEGTRTTDSLAEFDDMMAGLSVNFCSVTDDFA
ncbi:CAP domain-containing protein [Actibacterium sp. 188UL27-1]|uniref:CAP domain-containing protein n=1 Tax=Actibacterium sp. 188UL27-1 TaxID=2786961 RepID=UPI00195A1742|nr:CAP domain-containing protein [Actibacterium sp. 188UL27-1]MBM7066766.1 CAP domain-containing protein [Actibacterium sp. 188UL27-1]